MSTRGRVYRHAPTRRSLRMTSIGSHTSHPVSALAHYSGGKSGVRRKLMLAARKILMRQRHFTVLICLFMIAECAGSRGAQLALPVHDEAIIA